MEIISGKNEISEKYIEKLHFLPLNFPLIFRDIKKYEQTFLRHISCSEFYQVSGVLMHFCCKYHFMNEKRKQSGPIGKLYFKKFEF